MEIMGMYRSGALSVRRKDPKSSVHKVPLYLAFKNLEPYINNRLGGVHELVVKYRTKTGGVAHGIKAEIIPHICDVWLDAQEDGVLGERQEKIADKAGAIMRGLAHVAIVSLVDEATGYQYHRAPNALAQILEAFIAKELQPWVKTFPNEFYEQLFRLRGIEYDEKNVKRPQYFGHLTNDIIYKRLAPNVLEELKKTTPKTPKGHYKNKLFQQLTPDLGHPKLRELMASVITMMKMSKDYDSFKAALDQIHPPYNETMKLAFDDDYDGL